MPPITPWQHRAIRPEASAAPEANLAANSSSAQATQPTVAPSSIAASSTLAANTTANPAVEASPAKLIPAAMTVTRSANTPSKVEVALNKTPDALKPATFKLEGKTYHAAKMMFLPPARAGSERARCCRADRTNCFEFSAMEPGYASPGKPLHRRRSDGIGLQRIHQDPSDQRRQIVRPGNHSCRRKRSIVGYLPLRSPLQVRPERKLRAHARRSGRSRRKTHLETWINRSLSCSAKSRFAPEILLASQPARRAKNPWAMIGNRFLLVSGRDQCRARFPDRQLRPDFLLPEAADVAGPSPPECPEEYRRRRCA